MPLGKKKVDVLKGGVFHHLMVNIYSYGKEGRRGKSNGK
jgi:hypothetical protein